MRSNATSATRLRQARQSRLQRWRLQGLHPRELQAGLQDAARYDAKLIVERGIDARELEVGVLGNDDPQASIVGEILPGAEFYDYRAKYLDSGSRALIPADIPSSLADEVRRWR